MVFLIGLNEFFVFEAWDSLNPMGMAVNSHTLSPSDLAFQPLNPLHRPKLSEL